MKKPDSVRGYMREKYRQKLIGPTVSSRTSAGRRAYKKYNAMLRLARLIARME